MGFVRQVIYEADEDSNAIYIDPPYFIEAFRR